MLCVGRLSLNQTTVQPWLYTLQQSGQGLTL